MGNSIGYPESMKDIPYRLNNNQSLIMNYNEKVYTIKPRKINSILGMNFLSSFFIKYI